MADKRVVLSSRIDPATNEKLLDLVEHFKKESVGTVTKRVILEKAINDLYKREIDNELNENDQYLFEIGVLESVDTFLSNDNIKRLDEYILLTNPFKTRSDIINSLIENTYADFLRERGHL